MYNPFAGFDASAHIDYIHYLATHHAVPTAAMGWEMYQPPLYYAVAALLPSLAAVQYLGVVAWLVIVVAVWRVVQQPLITAWTALLPVLLYLMFMVSNELAAAALITVVLALYVRGKRTVFLGIVMGLALITKATAWVVLFAILVDYWWQKKRVLWAVLLPALIIGGWFYARNALLFHNPLVSPADFPQFQFWQPPGYRDIRFFADLSPFWKLNLFHAQWESLWAGTYFSFFYDGHNGLIPIQPFSKAGAAIVLLSYPLFALQLFGMVRKLKKPDPTRRFFILYTLLLWGGYIAYNLKLPFYSTVKGAFLTSLVLPAAYFLTLGFAGLRWQWRAVLYGFAVMAIAVTVYHFGSVLMR